MGKQRTDLALEAAQAVRGGADVEGVWSRERMEDGIRVTQVEIRTQAAAEQVGKPMGRYVTLDLTPVRRREKDSFQRACRALAEEIGRLLPDGEGAALVVGLGNRDITPDAVGPLVHDRVLVTRHLIDHLPEVFGSLRAVAALSAGVLGTTGVESFALVRAVAAEVKPSVVIAIDALAARSMKRLCTTVQISDTGVSPGSGVGNHRGALNEETLGVPVIAIGVPTVVEVSTLVRDVLEEAGREPSAELLRAEGLVTVGDIDEQVARWAKLIGCAVNLALQKGLSQEDLEGLTE